MDVYNCGCCKKSCSVYALILSIVLSAAFALISYFALLPGVIVAVSALVIGLILLPIELFAAIFADGNFCVCRFSKRVILGIIGSIVGALFSLVLSAIIGTTLTAIIIGLTILSLSMALTSIACMCLCLCDCEGC